MKNFIVKTIERSLDVTPFKIKEKAYYALQRSLRTDLANRHAHHNHEVSGGIFQGLKILDGASAQNYTLGHMLGIYELNIKKLIVDEMTHYKRFVDIGCASGIFSVGVPYITGKPSLGFDIDKTQIEYATLLADRNGQNDRTCHTHVTPDEDYNLHLKDGDLCLVDIEGGELNLIQSIKPDLRNKIGWVIEIHQIGDLGVDAVEQALINIMNATHDHTTLDESFHLDFKQTQSTRHLSRNQYANFTNSQRDYYQKWIYFKPKP